VKRVVSAALGLAAALLAHAAYAQTGLDLVVTGPHESVTQWIKFCEDYGQPPVCKPSERVEVIKMTPQRRKNIDRVNRKVNDRIRYVTDLEQWGRSNPRYVYKGVDKWDRGSKIVAGDCEDYALEKQRILVEEMGLPRSAVLITYVMALHKGAREWHVVLTLKTDDGDWILDIPYYSNEMKRWMETGTKVPHDFHFRQSEKDPGVWVNLRPPVTAAR